MLEEVGKKQEMFARKKNMRKIEERVSVVWAFWGDDLFL